ncbi:MAG: Tellurium resistance protein [Nocardioides sp.]|nr:Tellurium resistance protein [Nocardioides sp.]
MSAPADWHPDPSGRHQLRYWDGSRWTEHVADNGTASVDPLEGPPQASGGQQQAHESHGSHDADTAAQHSGEETGPIAAETPAEESQQESPAEESDPAATQMMDAVGSDEPADTVQPGQPAPDAAPHEVQASAPYAGQPYQPQASAVSPQQVPSDAFAGISGDLVDGRYAEVGATGVAKQNSKMLRVRVLEPFMARQGAMVAYQGNVQFAYQGGGAAKFLKKAFTGEGLSLMRIEGAGDVFLANRAEEVHVLHLDNSGISINGSNVLAFSAGLDWNVERVRGGSMATGGLFNTTLRGSGWVAITTDGEPVVLNTAEAPTYADTDAVVAWSAHLDTSLKSSFTAGALVGRGSGEAFQVAFSGAGFVIVQPSEGMPTPTAG